MKSKVKEIINHALKAVDPGAAVQRYVSLKDNLLQIKSQVYDLNLYQNIFILGAGKASGSMAAAIEQILGNRITAGVVVVKEGYTADTLRIKLLEASHPVPDEAGLTGTKAVMNLAKNARHDDLVIALISGGCSALLVAPATGLSLADLQATNTALLKCGATINEINTVRKHLSQVKGGKLARLVYPAALVTLVVSDVVGSPLDIIGSGPTIDDNSTPLDALNVINAYHLDNVLPASVLNHLQTTKTTCAILKEKQDQTIIIASNELAAMAAIEKAKDLGFHTMLLTTFLEGEAREVARVISAIGKEIQKSNRPLTSPACIVAGGETTVTVKGYGRGGRNQELALAAAIEIEGMENIAIVGLATDGTDGPTDAAGAWADGSTVRRGKEIGNRAAAFLADNNAYHFFRPLDDLIVTGPTNTNVNDLTFLFTW
ncbi:MAG: glycerate kinase [Anaerolineales bacterium]|nr:glycerate kinase [Anaerolineales bacterium]